MYDKQVEDLNKQRDDYFGSGQQASLTKSLSALSSYYEMVKFSDKSYYSWRLKANKEQADEYAKTLENSGYSVMEAKEEASKLETELNKKN